LKIENPVGAIIRGGEMNIRNRTGKMELNLLIGENIFKERVEYKEAGYWISKKAASTRSSLGGKKKGKS